MCSNTFYSIIHYQSLKANTTVYFPWYEGSYKISTKENWSKLGHLFLFEHTKWQTKRQTDGQTFLQKKHVSTYVRTLSPSSFMIKLSKQMQLWTPHDMTEVLKIFQRKNYQNWVIYGRSNTQNDKQTDKQTDRHFWKKNM